MQNNFLNRCIKLSRIIVTLFVFLVLNSWFLFENDPKWTFSIITSIVVFFISFPSSKLCKFFITKGDKIESNGLKVGYYIFVLPAIFILLLLVVGLFCFLFFAFIETKNLLNFGLAYLLVFIGIGIFTCLLVPYFQTLIILILRRFLKRNDDSNS